MKHNLLTNVFIFTVGALAGSAVTYKLLKDKFEQMAQEEIDSMKIALGRTAGMELGDYISSEKPEEDEDNEEYIEEESARCEEYREAVLSGSTIAPSNPDLKEYAANIASQNYAQYSETNGAEEDEEEMANTSPYVIPPEEFSELDGYDTSSLLYHADGVVVEMMTGAVIEHPEELVGEGFEQHFGEYEEDSVFVRNDELKCDYEILKDYDNYYEEN